MAERDPAYAKMILHTLQQSNEVAAAADLTDAMDKLDSYMTTHLINAVDTLSVSNAINPIWKGGATGDN